MTYEQLIESIDRLGSALRKRGFRPNDTVLFMAKNRLEIAISYLAVWLLEGCSANLKLDNFPGDANNLKVIYIY